ncbi:hypothetical protein B0H14DRAFT_3529989 [Mycena olivaceomarginata]|nr:hypothetical protein B0H14DRAFT_3529989 [Mycena olivaceomarginata]
MLAPMPIPHTAPILRACHLHPLLFRALVLHTCTCTPFDSAHLHLCPFSAPATHTPFHSAHLHPHPLPLCTCATYTSFYSPCLHSHPFRAPATRTPFYPPCMHPYLFHTPAIHGLRVREK